MRTLRILLIAVALAGGAVVATSATATAQMGVYEGEAQSLDQAARARQGIRISGTARQRVIPSVYTVRRGDTLWDVTGHYYGNPWEWPRVWSYNPEVTNPHWIYPQDQLRLLAPGAPVDPAHNVLVAPGRSMTGGSVFLRQEGYLDEDALDDAGVVAGSPEDHMLLAPYDQVYLEFDEGISQRPSGEYTVYREMPDRAREVGGEGTLVRIFGAVRIDSYDDERRTARATIIEALDPIERGFRVAPVPRRFNMVPPQVSDRNLQSHVAASLRPHDLLGEQQIVFIPQGAENGVQLGNRFFIVEAGDRWRDELSGGAEAAGAEVEAPPEPDAYPAEIVAEGRVVHVRPTSCTLMITRSVREVERGDRAEMRQGY